GRARRFVFETWMEPRVISHVRKILAVNRATAQYYATKFPSEKEKIKEIPLGLNLEAFEGRPRKSVLGRFNLPAQRPWVLFVGRISAEKNLPVLLSACERLRSSGTMAQLLVVGDGAKTKWLQKEIADLPWARWLGQVP